MALSEEIDRRRHANIHDQFKEDVEIYSKYIESIPSYDEAEIRKEIDQMDVSIDPNRLEYEDLLITYARLQQNHSRLTYLINKVYPFTEMCSRAYKSLKTVAVATFGGEGRVTVKDREANAEMIMQPLHIALGKGEILLKYLESYKSEINFSSTQLSTLLREKQSVAYRKNSYIEQGNSYEFTRAMESYDVSDENQDDENVKDAEHTNEKFTAFSGLQTRNKNLFFSSEEDVKIGENN